MFFLVVFEGSGNPAARSGSSSSGSHVTSLYRYTAPQD